MTNTDTQFAARFPGITAAAFNANQSDLANWTPTSSLINTGMLSDIGRATVYAPDIQESFFDRFMRAPLTRGDAAMSARFAEVGSRAYDPLAPDSALFNGSRPGMISNVARKNLSRQIAVEINDYMMKQFAQTPEMIGDAMAAIMAIRWSLQLSTEPPHSVCPSMNSPSSVAHTLPPSDCNAWQTLAMRSLSLIRNLCAP